MFLIQRLSITYTSNDIARFTYLIISDFIFCKEYPEV